MTRRCRVHGRLAPDEDCERCSDEAVITCPSCGVKDARPVGYVGDSYFVQLDCGDVVPGDTEGLCPECGEGVVLTTGPMEYDTGHTPYGCSANCGFGG